MYYIHTELIIAYPQIVSISYHTNSVHETILKAHKKKKRSDSLGLYFIKPILIRIVTKKFIYLSVIKVYAKVYPFGSA